MDTRRAEIAIDGGFDLGAFVRGAAHDIANPLNAISMNVELAKMLLDREQPARVREVLDRIRADCARFAQVVHGMQRFGSTLHPRPREVILARTLIEAAIGTAKRENSDAFPEFTIEDAAVNAQVCIDRKALERAIAGLFCNAREAGASVISIRTYRHEESVWIAIRDNGAGIPVELRSRVCDAFFTTRRAEGGNGLGLTLAHEVLRTHGGDLSIAEIEGNTCIELLLPVASEPV